MAVGAHHAGNNVADAHAVTHLRDGCLVMLTEHLQRHVLERRRLRRQFERRRFRRHVLAACGIAKRTPGRHHLAARSSYACVRIMACQHGKFSGHGFRKHLNGASSRSFEYILS